MTGHKRLTNLLDDFSTLSNNPTTKSVSSVQYRDTASSNGDTTPKANTTKPSNFCCDVVPEEGTFEAAENQQTFQNQQPKN